MTIKEIKQILLTDEYNFLKTNIHLGENIILLGLGGSYSYGTNIETSDIDIRGIALNTSREIMLGQDFEQVCTTQTDTVVYSFKKIIGLLSQCNPNVIELLGLLPEHYLVKTTIGEQLIENRRMFLSKAAVKSFGGYANQQLNRLENKDARTLNPAKQEEHIINSIKNAGTDFRNRYFPYTDDSINLYIDTNAATGQPDIFADISLKHYPLRDFSGIMGNMNNIIRVYDSNKIGQRNKNAAEHHKLAKHMMHLVRLYYMCFDILEKEEIITYRPEKDELMAIRNGKYFDANHHIIPEFYDFVGQLEKRLNYDRENTSLPDKVNKERIEDFVYSVNTEICK